MDLGSNIQEGVLTLLCFDPETAPIVEALVPPESFDVFYKDIATAAIAHRSKHGAVPGEHTYDLIQSLGSKDEASKDTYDAIFTSLDSLRSGIQSSYIVDQARNFARWSQLRKSWLKTGTALDRRDLEGLEAAESAIQDAIKPMADLFDPGADMSDVDRVAEIFDRNDFEVIPTGIPALDEHRAGPGRGRLHCLMASSGRGKSHYLCHLTRKAASKNYKVLYLSFEMSEPEVLQRLYQGFFGIAEQGKVESVLKLRATKDGQYDGMTRVEFDAPRPTLQDDSARARMEKNIDKAKAHLSNIRVKSFPQNTFTIERLRGYLDSAAMHSGFSPDMVVIDYADLWKKNPNDMRGSLRMIYEDLKGLAMDRNIAVATVTQSNRSGVNSKVITEDQIAEDFSKVQTADSLISLMSSEDEQSVGFARLFVLKNRGGKGRYMVGITQQYELSRFCVSSCEWTDVMEGDILSQPDPRGQQPQYIAETII